METINGILVQANLYTNNTTPIEYYLLLKILYQKYRHIYIIIEYYVKSGQFLHYHPNSINLRYNNSLTPWFYEFWKVYLKMSKRQQELFRHLSQREKITYYNINQFGDYY